MENLKHYGWGVVDGVGQYASYVGPKEQADRYADVLNEYKCDDRTDHHAIELFYKDES